MKLSDYVIETIKQNGVSHVFEFIGGAIVHLLDSISIRDDIQCVSVRHEQAAAFAAEAYARINGKLGVAMATSGPGALNLLTGIGSCYFDSIPCLFITGQVNTYEYKFDSLVRQIGFQETDIVSVAKPLTKYAQLVTDPASIRYELEKAIYIAQSGRPGPVLLDIPMNLQRAEIDPDQLESFFDTDEYRQLSNPAAIQEQQLNEIIAMLQRAQRPLVLAGGGVRLSQSSEELQRFLEMTQIPIVSSLMGIDAIEHNRHYFGLIGSYGNRYSNLAVANCDFLLILGSRLDSRQTGTRPDTFARAARKVHVDIDPAELNAKVKVDIAVQSDIRSFLTAINEKLSALSLEQPAEWLAKISALKEAYPTYSSDLQEDHVEPNRFLELLARFSPDGAIVSLDVGQHQMWASQSFQLKPGQRMLNSGGMGAMGFALPAAIGAALASEGKADVIVIAGDGGIQLNIQELDTIQRLQLPVKIFVLNNESLGMVRQFQDLYFDGRQQSTTVSNPNFIKIFEAYGIPSFHIKQFDQAQAVIEEALQIKGPVFVEVRLSRSTVVNPKLVVNRPIEDMYPHLPRKELQEVMLIELVEEMDVPK